MTNPRIKGGDNISEKAVPKLSDYYVKISYIIPGFMKATAITEIAKKRKFKKGCPECGSNNTKKTFWHQTNKCKDCNIEWLG